MRDREVPGGGRIGLPALAYTKEIGADPMPVVVIVDDQTINLKILSRFARAIGPEVVVRTFASGEQALEDIFASPPDLIVTDYVMPRLNGEDLIRLCRERDATREVPIIVVTAYEDRDFRYRALDAGASDFLVSPVDNREFRTRARNLLALRQHQQALRSRAVSLEHELESAAHAYAAEIGRREQQLRRVIDTGPALIRAVDAEGRILVLNSRHDEFFTGATEAAAGTFQGEAFGSEYAERHRELDDRVIAARATIADAEEALIDCRQRQRVLLTTKAPILAGDGRVGEIVTVSLDITERKEGERAVRESEQRFRNLVEGSVLGIVIERDGVPVFANRTYARIFGFETVEDLLAFPSLDVFFSPSERERLNYHRGQATTQPLASSSEYSCVRRDGHPISVEMVTQQVYWGGLPALQSTVADITLRKAYEERLHRQANFDEVTGLPNRVLAFDRLRRAVVAANRHHHKGALLFLDLDHFKKINDTWGHAIGDQLLRQSADRLLACIREEDTVARLGGDEFTIILPNLPLASHTEPVVHKILQAFSQPFRLDRHEAFVSASIGITVFPDDSDDPAQLMQNADTAMYRAKEQGRHTFQFFTPMLNQQAMERMRIEAHLGHALDRGEFEVHYQPIIDLRSGQIVGAEALLRWTNPELGSLGPDVFVPLAEDTGLIVPLGLWVVQTACHQLSQWRRHGLPDLGMAVNISSRQLRVNGLVDGIAAALAAAKIPPESLELEITEGCLMQDSAETTETIQALDRLGVRLALDDFGTGYSCLSYLKDLPVDTVKIDKSFTANVTTNSRSATVVEAIIAMAHRLGIRIIAEGVETEPQVDFMRTRGCDLAQGYYYSPPVAGPVMYDWCFGAERLSRRAR